MKTCIIIMFENLFARTNSFVIVPSEHLQLIVIHSLNAWKFMLCASYVKNMEKDTMMEFVLILKLILREI